MEVLLRVYFLQQWFNLSDPLAEEMLCDSESMRRFARVELGMDTVPDESTILQFRHLLGKHQLTVQMLAAVKEHLAARRLLLSAGTIVDATILGARADPGACRASLARDQAPMGRYVGPLPRTGEEHTRVFAALMRANLYLLRRRLVAA